MFPATVYPCVSDTGVFVACYEHHVHMHDALPHECRLNTLDDLGACVSCRHLTKALDSASAPRPHEI